MEHFNINGTGAGDLLCKDLDDATSRLAYHFEQQDTAFTTLIMYLTDLALENKLPHKEKFKIEELLKDLSKKIKPTEGVVSEIKDLSNAFSASPAWKEEAKDG